MVSDYLTIEEVVASYPWLSRGKLQQLRYEGNGPRYFKPTPRTVLYSREAIAEWVSASERSGTAASAA